MRHLRARFMKTPIKVLCLIGVGLLLVSVLKMSNGIPTAIWTPMDLTARNRSDHHNGHQNANNIEIKDDGFNTKKTIHEIPILPFPLAAQKPDYIFFNRVPKCGSTGTKAIFAELSKRNKWNFVASKIYDRERINSTAQAEFVREFHQRSPPVVFERHLNFINFTRFGAKMPVYINIVREPFERIVSDYYFLRYHLSHMFQISEERKSRTYDECVQGNYSECVADGPSGYYRIIPFFCGQEEFCRIPSWDSVNQAKRNVNKHYSVVGIVEELAGFMQVLERIVPAYFKGAHELFVKTGDKMKEKYETKKKIPPEEKTVTVMKKKLEYDYDFYSFIRQKFYATWTNVKKKPRRPNPKVSIVV